MTDEASSGPPQFPAGPPGVDEAHDDRHRAAWIDEIERAPTRLCEAVLGLLLRKMLFEDFPTLLH